MELELSEFWHILGLCNKYHDWVTVPGYRLLNSRLCVGFKIRDRDLKKFKPRRHKITRKRNFETHHERFRDFEIRPKFSETHVIRGTILHPHL